MLTLKGQVMCQRDALAANLHKFLARRALLFARTSEPAVLPLLS
jgi:hypothetical protein